MNTPQLIDLNKELKIVSFYNNTYNLNTFLFFFCLFLVMLIFIFSKNYSKKKTRVKIINKLNYIKKKANKYIKVY